MAHTLPVAFQPSSNSSGSASLSSKILNATEPQIDQALHPILGHRGVAALFKRSVKHTAARFPWLGQDPQDALAVVDPSVLKAALLLQTAAEATAGVDSLFQSLRDLLTSLVGSSLTDQLLWSVWAHSPGESRDRHSP